MKPGTNRLRFAILILCLLVWSSAEHAQPPQVTTAILEGRVLRQGNSDAIPQAHLTLIRLNPNLPTTKEAIHLVQSIASLMKDQSANVPGFIEGFLNPNAQAINVPPDVVRPISVSSAVSDETGSFKFDHLPAGRYILTAEREGYYAPPVGDDSETMITRIVDARNGEVPTSIELRMVQAAAISGQIHDPLGKPVPGIRVETYQLSYPNGVPTWDSKVNPNYTNDTGEFRFTGLRPGQYFIGVIPRVIGYVVDSQWARTFYPGTVDPMAAQELTIREGEDVKGIDITIRTSNTGKYKISGIAINSRSNSADKSISEFYVVPRVPLLTDGTRLSPHMNVLPAATRTNGEFEIWDVEPGLYDLYPMVLDFNSRRYFTSRTPIEVRNGDIRGLSLSVDGGSTLSAELVLTGTNSQSIKLDSLQMNLTMLRPARFPFASILGSLPFSADGRLKVENVPEATYAIAIAGLPGTAYISDIRQGDRSIYDEGVDVGKVPLSIQVQVDLSGGSIGGVVETSDATPAASVTVILVPRIEHRRNRSLFKVVSTNSDGHFSMNGVMPGQYTILALHDHPPREPWLNTDFLSQYLGRAQSITVTPGSSTDIQLGLIQN
jgi:hypothetical protein